MRRRFGDLLNPRSNLNSQRAMSALNEPAPTLRFFCPSCRAELAVPSSLAGVEGPCPSCFQTIRAPANVARPVAAAVSPLEWQSSDAPILAAPTWPPPVPAPAAMGANSLASLPEALLTPRGMELPEPGPGHRVLQAIVTAAPADKNFRPRRAIPAAEEPADDSWRDRHLKQQRSSRRARRAERAAHQLLESRGFRFARVALILLSGAMLAFLLHYLQSHQWRFPGMSASVTEETPRTPAPTVRPVGADVNELMTDDDTEIPPASDTIPAATGTGTVAAQPR
jgi:hypothetical protein